MYSKSTYFKQNCYMSNWKIYWNEFYELNNKMPTESEMASTPKIQRTHEVTFCVWEKVFPISK